MQTINVQTRRALRDAIKAGISTIIVANPRLALKILQVLKFKKPLLAMSTISPTLPVVFPALRKSFCAHATCSKSSGTSK